MNEAQSREYDEEKRCDWVSCRLVCRGRISERQVWRDSTDEHGSLRRWLKLKFNHWVTAWWRRKVPPWHLMSTENGFQLSYQTKSSKLNAFWQRATHSPETHFWTDGLNLSRHAFCCVHVRARRMELATRRFLKLFTWQWRLDPSTSSLVSSRMDATSWWWTTTAETPFTVSSTWFLFKRTAKNKCWACSKRLKRASPVTRWRDCWAKKAMKVPDLLSTPCIWASARWLWQFCLQRTDSWVDCKFMARPAPFGLIFLNMKWPATGGSSHHWWCLLSSTRIKSTTNISKNYFTVLSLNSGWMPNTKHWEDLCSYGFCSDAASV